MSKYAVFNDHSKEKSSFIKNIFDNISVRYDLLNGVLSLWTYKLWHRRVLRESAVGKSGKVVDFCTGTGELLIKFNRRLKLSKGVGIDISDGMLEIARKKTSGTGLEFLNVPAEETGLNEEFDCATIAFALRNVKDVSAVFSEMTRVTKEGGKVIALELTTPRAKMLKAAYKVHLKLIIPAIGRVFSGNKEAYEYLGKSIINFPGPEVILGMMREAGLKNCRAVRLSLGTATMFIGEK